MNEALNLPRRRTFSPLTRAAGALVALAVLTFGFSGLSSEPRPVVTAVQPAHAVVDQVQTPAAADDEAAPPPPPPAAAERAPVDQALVDHLHGLVAKALDHQVGVVVTDARGRTVVDINGDAQMLPASTAKMLTAAAALVELGADFRYTTRAAATAPVGPDGIVHGDLVLIGSGDPALGTPMYAQVRGDRPRTPLEVLADRVAAAGVRHVAGRVIGDTSVFSHEPIGPGWPASYLEHDDAVRSSGLTVDGGRRVFRSGGLRSEPVVDPGAWAAEVFNRLLWERGVSAGGGSAVSHTRVPARHPIAGVESAPLSETLRYVVQRSDNQLADGVFRTVGLRAGNSGWASSAQAVRVALAKIGVATDDAVIADGSGLSRDNRATPRLLTELDLAMARSAHGPVWNSLPAVAAASGTLARRLVDTPADHRVRGKTGTLRDVRALTGNVVVHSRARWRFAIIGNSLDGNGAAALLRLQDEMSLVLASEAQLCEAEPGCSG